MFSVAGALRALIEVYEIHGPVAPYLVKELRVGSKSYTGSTLERYVKAVTKLCRDRGIEPCPVRTELRSVSVNGRRMRLAFIVVDVEKARALLKVIEAEKAARAAERRARAEAEKAARRAREEALRARIAELRARVRELERELARKERELEKAVKMAEKASEAGELRKRLRESEESRKRLRQEVNELRRELRSLRSSIMHLLTELARLATSRDELMDCVEKAISGEELSALCTLAVAMLQTALEGFGEEVTPVDRLIDCGGSVIEVDERDLRRELEKYLEAA